MSYVELSIKSNFTFLKGGSHPEEYAHRATDLGLDSFAITDENSVSGIVRAHNELRKIKSNISEKNTNNLVNTRLIPGTEINSYEGLIITALAKDRIGWANICRILTQGKLKEKKGSCKITINEILKYGNHIAFLLHLPKNINHDKWINLSKKIINRFPETSLILSPQYDGQDSLLFMKTAKLAKSLNIKLSASACPIMHHSKRRRIVDVLSAIRNNCTIENLGYLAEKNAERRIRSPNELKEIFINYQDALTNSANIAKSCKFSLDELKHQYPSEIHDGETPNSKLTRLTYEGLNWRYPQGVPTQIQKQTDHELILVKKLNYSPYFLTVYDIVNFARSRNILCQGRGSAANSIICYSLGITSVSPEVGTMVFERFVSESRNEPPDIDVDFEHERREEVIQYIYKKFGRHRTGLCATVVHYRKKRALREIGKVMNISIDTITILLSQLSSWKKSGSKHDKLKEIGLNPSNRRLLQTLSLVDEIIGFPRHLSQHVGGFVITEDRLDELIPIENATMLNRTVISWDKDDIDTLGILKVDILGLGMLSCIKKAFSLINSYHNKNYDLASIPPDDTNVYDMLCKADTIGVFQVESRAQMNFLPRMLPRCFYDLVIQIAIVRPGPIQGNMVHPYIKRRQGKEPIEFPSNPLKKILNKTLGIPLFQEQAMQIAIIGAGFSPEESDRLRRALATFKNNGNVSIFHKRFISGMLANGYDKKFSEKCFSQIEGFSKYGFPESHAASFALIVYASAWIKCYHPGIFACALLNSQPMGFYSTSQIITDAMRHGVKIRPVCINNSLWDNTIERDKKNNLTLRIGFRQIRGLSKSVIEEIITLRKHGFQSIYDLWSRLNLPYQSISKLVKSDCFSSLGLKREEALWEIQRLRSQKSPSLFQNMPAKNTKKNGTTKLPNTTIGTELLKDYKSFNFSLRSHPMALLRQILNTKY